MTWITAVLLCAGIWGCGAREGDFQPGASVSPPDVQWSVLMAAVELVCADPPPGGQSVWIANRGATARHISCWRIPAAPSGVSALITDGPRLAPGRALRFSTPAR